MEGLWGSSRSSGWDQPYPSGMPVNKHLDQDIKLLDHFWRTFVFHQALHDNA